MVHAKGGINLEEVVRAAVETEVATALAVERLPEEGAATSRDQAVVEARARVSAVRTTGANATEVATVVTTSGRVMTKFVAPKGTKTKMCTRPRPSTKKRAPTRSALQ